MHCLAYVSQRLLLELEVCQNKIWVLLVNAISTLLMSPRPTLVTTSISDGQLTQTLKGSSLKQRFLSAMGILWSEEYDESARI